LSDFQRGQIVGVHLAGASVNKMATLLGVSRTAVIQGCDGIHKSWECIISLEK
jgi:DNA-binding transcriptional regulator YdaS (Cro superfamily)